MKSTVEIKKSPGKTVPKKLNCICLVCDKQLSAVLGLTSHNAEVYPSISGGVVFRSSGQYGSTVLDSGVGIPYPWGKEVQIIICDECLLKKAAIVNTTKNKRAVIERLTVGDRAVEWSDYASFEDLKKVQERYYKACVKILKKKR